MPKPAQTRSGAEPRSQSYLIRFWPEPREGIEGDEIWRGYVRDLRTGEEQYLSGPNELVRVLISRLARRGVEPGQREQAAASTATGSARSDP